jgi:hypothetical protein
MKLKSKYLDILENRYKVDLIELRGVDIKPPLKDIKRCLKQEVFNLCGCKVKKLNLHHFESIWGGVDVIKLDTWLYNQLLDIGYKVNNMSGLEKLEYYIDNEIEYKKIKWLIM